MNKDVLYEIVLYFYVVIYRYLYYSDVYSKCKFDMFCIF